MAAAAAAAGRDSGEIRLIAVSKKMSADDVAAAIAAGSVVTFADLRVDPGDETLRVRRAMERAFAPQP